ncbi:UNVERIFIED_CONTAM: di/tricarboxylate transporter [Brevibacillus sp. OAP136]
MNQIEMLHGLSKVEQARLLGKLERISYQNGETVFEQGAAGDSMYLIQSGKIELFTQGPDGRRFSLVVLTPGEAFGEMALLTGEARTATAIAVGDTVLMRIDAETFIELVNEKTSISAYFIRLLSKRLVQTNHNLQDAKEERARQFAAEFRVLDPTWHKVILRCAHVPYVSKRLILRELNISTWEEGLRANPSVGNYVKPVEENAQLLEVLPGARSKLIELYGATSDTEGRHAWMETVAADFLQHGEIGHGAYVFAYAEKWEKLLGLLTQKRDQLERADWNIIISALTQCPEELLFCDFSLLLAFLQECVKENPELGIVKLDAALGQRTSYFSDDEAIALYRIGAELCRQQHPAKSLEYLNAAMGLSQQTAAAAANDENRTFFLAKLSLDGMKRNGLVDAAGKLFAKNKLITSLSVLLAIGCIVFFSLSAPFGGLSHQGMAFIGVAIAAVIFWIINIIPDFIVALFMAMYWVMDGLVKPEVALSGYASPVWLYMLFILALGAAITKSGILYRLSLYALKAFPSHYRGQLWGITVSGLLLNPLIPSSSAKATLGVPIAQTISESMGFADRSKGAAGLGLAAMIFYGFMAPFVLTGSYTNVMAYGLVAGNSSLSWFQWFWYALPAFVVFTIGMLAVILIFFKPKAPAKPITKEVIDDQIRILGALTREEKITIAVTLACIVLLMLQPLHGIDNAWVMLIGFAVFVITGVLDAKTLKSGIDWPFLLFIGIAFSFAEVATQLGVADVMAQATSQYMAPFMTSPYLFLIAVSLLSFLVTLIIRDDPAVILLVMSMLPLAQKMEIHPWVLVFIILLSTDPFFFAYQSPTYLTAYYSTEERSFTHKQGQFIAVCYAIMVLILIVACVPFWQMIGLIH